MGVYLQPAVLLTSHNTSPGPNLHPACHLLNAIHHLPDVPPIRSPLNTAEHLPNLRTYLPSAAFLASQTTFPTPHRKGPSSPGYISRPSGKTCNQPPAATWGGEGGPGSGWGESSQAPAATWGGKGGGGSGGGKTCMQTASLQSASPPEASQAPFFSQPSSHLQPPPPSPSPPPESIPLLLSPAVPRWP